MNTTKTKTKTKTRFVREAEPKIKRSRKKSSTELSTIKSRTFELPLKRGPRDRKDQDGEKLRAARKTELKLRKIATSLGVSGKDIHELIAEDHVDSAVSLFQKKMKTRLFCFRK